MSSPISTHTTCHESKTNKESPNVNKTNVNKCCPQCGFDPIAFSESIPNFHEIFNDPQRADKEMMPGGILEGWRGALSGPRFNYLCWKCAH